MSNFAKKNPFSHVPTPLMYGFFKNLLLYWLVFYSIVYMHVFYTQIITTANQLMAYPHLITHLSA